MSDHCYDGTAVRCPICSQATLIDGAEYSAPVRWAWPGGRETEPARFLYWKLRCGHQVSGESWTLFVQVVEPGPARPELTTAGMASWFAPADAELPMPIPTDALIVQGTHR